MFCHINMKKICGALFASRAALLLLHDAEFVQIRPRINTSVMAIVEHELNAVASHRTNITQSER